MAERVGTGMQRVRLHVPMRDGVRLATDVYWATGGSLEEVPPGVVLLERTPYDVSAERASDGRHADGSAVTPESGARYFTSQGYVVVRQDCRGCGASEGTFSKYVGEADDGYDTYAWLVAQPWCDGRIVTQGVSYSAHTQAAAASVGAPGIAAMILDSGGFASAYEAGGRLGGAFELKQVVWAYRRALRSRGVRDDKVLTANLESQDLWSWFRSMPWQRGSSPLSALPEYEDFVFEQWSHEDLDDFWEQPGLYARGYYDRFPDVPVLNISSWYDPYVLTAVENFEALRRKHPSTRLVLGPWTHGSRSVSHAGDVDFGPEATLDGVLAPDYLQFKAAWLRDVLDGVAAAQRPVSYFLMGGGDGRREDGRLLHGGRWLHADAWPPAEVEHRVLYLDEGLSLAPAPPAVEAEVSFDFDPRDPVPSIGGAITSGEPLMSGGAFDQVVVCEPSGALLPLSARRDVLAFQTPQLDEPMAVVGPVVVELDFSSSAADTDLAVKLVDVYPSSEDYPCGFAMNVTDTMLRCRYRDGFDRPRLMEPGTTYRIVVRLPDTANLFAAGHRIRVDITSSNFPRCDVNPNTGRPVLGDRTFEIARNTVHVGASLVRLPVLPQAALGA